MNPSTNNFRLPVLAWIIRWAVIYVAAVQPGLACSMQADTATDAWVDDQRERVSAIENASPATVCILGRGGQGGGSGVVVTPDGFALTNFHVVQACDQFMQCGMSDGRVYDAVLVGIDPTGDLALIRLLGRDDFPTATLADSDQVRVGDPCFAAGNPFLLATDFEPSISWGIVSGTHRYQFPSGTILEYTDALQTDAAINPGNSGGPLFNARGQLIGIIGRASFEKRKRINVGVGYAISSNQARQFYHHLKSGRIVDHATTGFRVIDEPDGRVVIDQILQESSAYRQGIRLGDELVAFAGTRIRSANEFKNRLGIFPHGWRVTVVIRSAGGVERSVVLRLDSVHDPIELRELVTGGGSGGPAIEPDVDPKWAALFESRVGFANYHFNRIRQNEIWEAFSQNCRPSSRPVDGSEPWRLKLLAGQGDEIATVVLANDQAGWRSEAATLVLESGELPSLNQVDDTALQTLACLHLYRKWMIEGPDLFGDVIYEGRVPWFGLDGKRRGQVDVLQATADGASVRWMMEPGTGQLRAMEWDWTGQAEPIVVEFAGQKVTGAWNLPATIDVRTSAGSTTAWQVNQWSVGPLNSLSAADDPGQATPVPIDRQELRLAGDDGKPLPANEPVEKTLPRMVKIDGGGGFRGLEPYQSGFLISADGWILTVWSYVLDADAVEVTLANGRRQPARLVGYDPQTEIAVLKIDVVDQPCFDLTRAADAQPGQSVWAFSNLYRVATGNEPVSVQAGRVAGVSRLQAGRRNVASAYRGPILTLDVTTNNPGAAGGAVVNREGTLVGLIGKEYRDVGLGTWLNFAVPIAELKPSIEAIQNGTRIVSTPDDTRLPTEPVSLELWGIGLVPDVVRQTPPFVDSVVAGSPAAAAGVKVDDLIIRIGPTLTPSGKAVREQLRRMDRDRVVVITVERDGEFRVLTVEPGSGPLNR